MKMTVKDNKLLIEADLTQDQGPSKSGKTTIIDTTHGEVRIQGADRVFANINIYRK